jgi:hypothetical protein
MVMPRLCGRPNVSRLIHRQFGVRYHRDHIGRLLGQMGWSCQRPTGRARERKEEEIVRWKRVEWPRIKKSQRRRMHSPLHRRKRAEPEATLCAHLESKGQTPVLEFNFNWKNYPPSRGYLGGIFIFASTPVQLRPSR